MHIKIILEKLPVCELIKLQPDQWVPGEGGGDQYHKWRTGCENELVRRLENKLVQRNELLLANSFLHFVIDQTLRTGDFNIDLVQYCMNLVYKSRNSKVSKTILGSQILLNYILHNDYVSDEDVRELDNSGRTIVHRVMNDTEVPRQNR